MAIFIFIESETPWFFFIESETPCFFFEFFFDKMFFFWSYHVIDMKFQPSITDGKFSLENLRSTQDTFSLRNKCFCIHMSQGLNTQLIA